MAFIEIPHRRKPLAESLLRTVPFIAAGILSLLLYYSQDSQSFEWKRDTVIILVFALLSWAVFFTVAHQLPYSKKNIIDDILLTALFLFEKDKYRINIMEIRCSEVNLLRRYFKITYSHGYSDAFKYHERITENAPGASEAYRETKVVYTGPKKLKREIDPDVKHLWSAPIKNHRGDSVAVLNIDNVVDEVLGDDVIFQLLNAIERLTNVIEPYWEIPG